VGRNFPAPSLGHLIAWPGLAVEVKVPRARLPKWAAAYSFQPAQGLNSRKPGALAIVCGRRSCWAWMSGVGDASNVVVTAAHHADPVHQMPRSPAADCAVNIRGIEIAAADAALKSKSFPSKRLHSGRTGPQKLAKAGARSLILLIDVLKLGAAAIANRCRPPGPTALLLDVAGRQTGPGRGFAIGGGHGKSRGHKARGLRRRKRDVGQSAIEGRRKARKRGPNRRRVALQEAAARGAWDD